MTKSKTQPSQKARVLYWFRTDLRVHDSPALQAALALEQEVGIEAFYPVSRPAVEQPAAQPRLKNAISLS